MGGHPWALWMFPSRLRLSDALTGTPFLADREPDAMKWSTPGQMHGHHGPGSVWYQALKTWEFVFLGLNTSKPWRGTIVSHSCSRRGVLKKRDLSKIKQREREWEIKIKTAGWIFWRAAMFLTCCVTWLYNIYLIYIYINIQCNTHTHIYIYTYTHVYCKYLNQVDSITLQGSNQESRQRTSKSSFLFDLSIIFHHLFSAVHF